MDDAAPAAAADAEDKRVAAEAPFWFPSPRVFIVGWMMVSTFVLTVLCWWRPPPASNQIVIMLISVYASTGFVTALQWWMGSSKSSDDKNAPLISAAMNNSKQGQQ
jgi:hypothetical protein